MKATQARWISGKTLSVAMIVVALALAAGWAMPGKAEFYPGRLMPQFSTTSQALWINSKPLKRQDIAGKVVLLEIWTSV